MKNPGEEEGKRGRGEEEEHQLLLQFDPVLVWDARNVLQRHICVGEKILRSMTDDQGKKKKRATFLKYANHGHGSIRSRPPFGENWQQSAPTWWR